MSKIHFKCHCAKAFSWSSVTVPLVPPYLRLWEGTGARVFPQTTPMLVSRFYNKIVLLWYTFSLDKIKLLAGACPIKKLMRIKFNIDINSNGKFVIELRRALS